MIQVLKAMIVREIQEHKVAFVYAPFFVSIISVSYTHLTLPTILRV